MNVQEARSRFQADRGWFEDRGVILHGVTSYTPDAFKRDYRLAMDAQPALNTDPSSAVPAMLTTYVDPAIYEVLFAPNNAAKAFGEEKKGDWLMDTVMFPVVEHTGEVSSYGDFNENGRAGLNTNFPQRQSYHWQTVMNYGERELARAGLARINWVSEINNAAATVMDKYENLTYLFGVAGLQNYGLTNDPHLPAALTPATKANGGTAWFTSGGAPNASANEVYNDIIALFESLVTQNGGLVDKSAKMTLVMSPGSEVALTFTNSFAVNVEDLLKKNFPSMTVQNIPQYGVLSTQNSQGLAAGNLVQLIVDSVEGQDTGYCAYTEKMRSHPIIRQLSSFRQKVTGGSWGAVIRYAAGFTQMLGV